MELLIERDMLLEAMTRIMGAVQTRVTAPILAHVRLDAGALALRITGTDMDIEVDVPVPAEVQRQGVTTVDARLFYEMLRKQEKGAQLAISGGDGGERLVVARGRSKFGLLTLDAADFPSLNYADGAGVEFEVSSGALRRMFDATRFAVCDDETRHYLHGMYLHVRDEVLRGVATNGHVFSHAGEELPAGAASMAGVIVPLQVMAVLDKFLPANDCEVVMEVSTTRMRVSIGDARLTAKFIDGTFPDYQRVIPTEHAGTAVVPRLALLAAVERVGVVLNQNSNAVSLHFADGEVRVSAMSADRGNGEDAVAECAFDGAPVTVGAAYKYLEKVLRASSANQICIKLSAGNAADGPMRFEDVDGDARRLMVLMPMRV